MKDNLEAILVYRPAILKGLQAHLRQYGRKSGTDLRWTRDVAERLTQFTAGGKLLRGSLVCYSYRLCGGQDPLPPSVLHAAFALELSHASLLIHDDIIDRDDWRRAQPAIHYQYGQLFGDDLLAAPHLGESLAICAGDMALFMAFELLGGANGEQPPDTIPLSAMLARELAAVCSGQMQDVYLAGSAYRPTKREIFALMRAKSAGYSVAFPLMAGAVLANQPAAVQRRLYDLGMAAGTIFQIRDDELGALGHRGKLGKPVGADIREGKKTLLHYYLWQAADSVERQRLAAVFGNPNATDADINAVQQALRQHNVSARLQKDLDQLKRAATRHINQLKLPQARKQELRRFVEFCASREA